MIALAIGLLSQMNDLESVVYDSFQRYQYRSASSEILLLTVDSRTETQKDIWSDHGFAQLTEILRGYGARLIVATQPLALSQVPDEDQVRALIKLQEQAQRSGSHDLKMSGQLNIFRDRFDEREALIDQLQKAQNVVLTAYTTSFEGTGSNPQNCVAHEINLQGTDDESLTAVRRVRFLATPPERVCDSASAIGFGNFYPDRDGVVRSAELFVNADNVFLPSLALAAASAGDNHNIIIASPNTFSLRDHITHTGNGFQILNRYYNGRLDEPAFQTATVSAVLNRQIDPAQVKGRIVLVGETVNDDMPGIKTPVSTKMPPMEVVATSLSNLLDGDYLLRPTWLSLMETGLLLAVLLIVLLWMPVMPNVGAALAGLLLATLLLSIEAYLLVSDGIWLQLATTAAFAAVAVWTMHFWNVLRPQQPRTQHASHGAAIPPKTLGEHREIDLEFSVLRQQAPTEQTKQKMYEIAIIHGRAKEYACAERVLSHIAKIDPDYKNVSELLTKLSGAKKKSNPTRKRSPTTMPTDRKTLGRYEIDRVVGRGAMATVYLGRDPAINRKVAIKTIALATEFDAEELEHARTQFRREAESAGRLNHPNIIAIYDAGEDDDVSYLAMEYFEGASLLEHAQPDNLLSAKWVLELAARAAEALDYAHRQNVVHRDIKPANLMYHQATDTLKLTDFGIARLTDSSRTKTGVILGTPSYMSPEQLSGERVTGQSDLYSLGVTMYQLLTGSAPFRADSIPELMEKIMGEQHPRVTKIRMDVPDCVDAILDKAMAKEPNDRYENGREMAVALRACARDFKKT
jgi:serine/threonine-protein kinase